jgi:peptidoglycan hydrolase CwlO-like protein
MQSWSFSKFHKKVLFGLIILGSIVTYQTIARAESLEEIEAQIGDLQRQLEQSVSATTPLESEVNNLSKQLASIQAQVNASIKKTKDLEASITEREATITDSYKVLSAKVRDYYKRARFFSPILTLMTSQSIGDLTRGMIYRATTADEDKNLIVNITQDILNLEDDKKQVEADVARLAGLQKKLDTQKAFFEKEIAGAKKYQAELSGKIATLTAKQQAILSARSGSFITGVGSVPIGSDYDASIAGFSENAPGGSFAVFSFGAYTHRKGMSQYGARARADGSQDFETILEAYYGKRPVSKETGGNIKVSGYGEINFEDTYLMGIAEMPSDWPMEALKAQAVAARTYAYRYKIENKEICITEACQVFSKSKADNTPEAWRQAVQQTRGKVLEDVVTFYSSTTGGYLTTSGWDTTDKNGGGDWTSRAWESKAGSPWFYKAWYRNGYKNSDNSCGRKPWLSEEEMADIINAWLILKKGEGSDVDTGRVLPVTIGSCSIGGQGGDPYSMTELRSKLGDPVTSISGKPVISHDGSGNTQNVRLTTNRGELNVPGSEFKEVFNTRAPGYISIPQKGFAFFNIERK